MSFIRNISVSKLGKYSAVGGVFCIFSLWIGRRSLKAKYEEQAWCRKTLKLLRNHTAANYILGQGFHVGVSHSYLVYLVKSKQTLGFDGKSKTFKKLSIFFR